jgi:hypothetical protein
MRSGDPQPQHHFVSARRRSSTPSKGRLEYLALGGVINYDLADYNARIRLKANTTVVSENGVVAKLFVVTFAKKLF